MESALRWWLTQKVRVQPRPPWGTPGPLGADKGPRPPTAGLPVLGRFIPWNKRMYFSSSVSTRHREEEADTASLVIAAEPQTPGLRGWGQGPDGENAPHSAVHTRTLYRTASCLWRVRANPSSGEGQKAQKSGILKTPFMAPEQRRVCRLRTGQQTARERRVEGRPARQREDLRTKHRGQRATGCVSAG